MIKKQSVEEQLATMQHLINFGVNESASNVSKPIVEFKRKAANGKTYGIIRDTTKYYIMEAPQKDTEVLAEDFAYIGGFNNRKEHEYSSYAKASNALDLKLMSINETVQKEDKIIIQKPIADAQWEDKVTESMRKEINRFNQLTENVDAIQKGKAIGSVPSEHTLPEAPETHPSTEKVNYPFTDTAVANGEKDMKEANTDHQTAGKPFNTNGKITNDKMTSDKKPSIKTSVTYSETPKHTPDNAVADQNPSGGKAVRVSENRKPTIRLKLTEEQVLAWNDNKNFIDDTKGTEIGSSEPYVVEEEDVSKLSDENVPDYKISSVVTGSDKITNVNVDDIKENNSIIGDYEDEQNQPTPGTNEVGEGNPYEEKVNEANVKAEEAAGLPDEEEDFSDYPFPDVAKKDNGVDDEEDEFIIDLDNDGRSAYKKSLSKFGKDGMRGLENWENDWNKFDDEDDYFDYDNTFEESKSRRKRGVNEAHLNAFGKHPAYRKVPMTTPPNKEVARKDYKVWDDESAQGEEPFGIKIGDSAPFDELVDSITESIMEVVYGNKKKV